MNRRRLVVVIGGGFIGSHLTETLIKAGSPVPVVDNFSTAHLANLAPPGGAFRWIKGNVSDFEAACRAGEWIVFH